MNTAKLNFGEYISFHLLYNLRVCWCFWCMQNALYILVKTIYCVLPKYEPWLDHTRLVCRRSLFIRYCWFATIPERFKWQRPRRPCWMTGTIKLIRILLLMVIQHGGDDVSCKPRIVTYSNRLTSCHLWYQNLRLWTVQLAILCPLMPGILDLSNLRY